MPVHSLRRGLLFLSSNSTIPNPSPFPNPPLLPFIALRFLSAQASEEEDSPTVSALVDSLGSPPETAPSVFRKHQDKDRRNAGSVIRLLKSRDFSAAQISEMVRRWPQLLRLKPERTLLPKLEFFQSKGLLRPDLAELLSPNPFVLSRSLERCIIPNFNFFRNLLNSDVKALQVIIRVHRAGAHKITVVPNLKYLRDNGVSESNVAFILRYQPEKLYVSRARLSEAMSVLKGMGLDPQKSAFLHALAAVLGMSKSSWEGKLRVYRNWGWSEEECLSAFRKSPQCMMASEDKINRVMSFFVDRMGWKPSLIAEHPILLTYSFEKRIIPRAAVLQLLLSEGLLKKNYSVVQFFKMSEMVFMKRIAKFPEVAPRILAIYEEELNKPR
ncbi:uncharacterized protein LOC116195366 [Punica granatum]|uniref:Uncharacterized protein LOC116195366 n=2 Tax=Punica granatum TaxID=22663 RepID=A0A6P8CBK6_PUNGR|nr:uncharacterized protein LOC116195366 [Punica granatum]PKI65073.1 hypothetical protein CRG98_014542 [Punica granatum]